MRKLTKKDLDLIYKTVINSINFNNTDNWDDYLNNAPAAQMVLALYYWELMPVNKKLLSVCMSIEDDQWDKFFDYCGNLWEKKAKLEIKKFIKKFENEPIA